MKRRWKIVIDINLLLTQEVATKQKRTKNCNGTFFAADEIMDHLYQKGENEAKSQLHLKRLKRTSNIVSNILWLF